MRLSSQSFDFIRSCSSQAKDLSNAMANNLVRGRFFGSENVTVFLSELLGTALLVFFGCSSCIFWPEYSPMSTLPVVLSFGLAVMISVQIFSCVSGCHINPAVTVAATIYNLISVKVRIKRIIYLTKIHRNNAMSCFI